MTARSWFPAETTRAGAEHLNVAYVAAYDQKAGTDPTDDLLLLRELDAVPDLRVSSPEVR